MFRIPKVLHMYWDGSPMSKLQTITVTSFCKLNPDWKIIINIDSSRYTGSKKYIPSYLGKDYFYLLEDIKQVTIKDINVLDYNINENLHPILRSDILRYYWLYNYGGVWSDFDVIWLKPMEYLDSIAAKNSFGATICMFNDGVSMHHNIGILVSTKYHEFYREIMGLCYKIQNNIPINPNHQEFGVSMLNKIYPSPDNVLDKFSDIVSLGYSVFYPYSVFNMKSLYFYTDLSYITDSVMCVHWFNGHRLSKDYINNNKYNFDCSMTSILKNGGYL